MPSRYLLSPPAAAAVADLVRDRGGVSTEERRIAPPAAAPTVMPFDVRLVPAGSAYDVYCAIFPGYVNAVVYGFETRRRGGGGTGTASDPWVKVGTVSGTFDRYLVLALTPPATTDGTLFWTTYEWDLDLVSAFDPSNLPAWAWGQSPMVPIARLKRGRSGFPGGVLQMHRGAVVLGTPAVAPYSIAANLRLNGIGNAGGDTVASWENSGLKRTFVKNIDLGSDAGTVYHGNTQKVVARTITDGNGVDHTVLEVVQI